MPSATLTWKKKRDPLLPAEPTYHDPARCMNCGHHKDQHHPDVGCLVEGGTKYVESDEHAEGAGIRACSCEGYIPAPEAEVTK